MCFLKSLKQLTVIFSIWRIRGTYTAWIIFLFDHEAEVEAFSILPPFPSCLTSCLYFLWFSDVSMSSFECVPHFFGRFAFWYPEKFIRIQCRSYYVLANTIKLDHLTFFIGPLGPRFFKNRSVLLKLWNERAIFDWIPNSLINGFNKDFHSSLPILVIQSTK